MIGKTINGAILEKEIHKSSTGIVYLGKDALLQVPRAIKIIHPQITANEVARGRLKNAIKSWARMDHPNFIYIFAAIDTEEALGYIMDYVEGISLQQIIKNQGKLGVSQAVDYFLQIAKALSFAHKNSILHRKLSSQNIVICRDESLKVLGLGALKDLSATSLTPTNVCIGKPYYMAPEQFGGKYSNYTDQYSLGTIFYEMLTGQPPFVTDDIRKLYKLHLQTKPKTPRKLNADITPELQTILMTILSKKPENRFPDLDNLIDAVMVATDRIDFSKDISVETLMYRGRRAIERRNLDHSIYFFSKVLSIYGEKTAYFQEAKESRSLAIEMYREDKDIRRMRSLLTDALVEFDEENMEEVRKYLVKIVEIMRHYPNSSRVRGVRMDIAREMPDILEEVETFFQEQIAQAEKLTQQGKLFLEEYQYDDAIETFEQALTYDPENKDAISLKKASQLSKQKSQLAQRYCQGKKALKDENFKQATISFKQMLEIQPDHQEAQELMNNSLETEDKRKKLKSQIEQIYHDGLELYEKWQYSQALEKFSKVLELDPNHVEAKQFLDIAKNRQDEDSKIEDIGFYYQQGVSFHDEQKWREAVACFNCVLKEIPTHKNALEYKRVAEENLQQTREL